MFIPLLMLTFLDKISADEEVPFFPALAGPFDSLWRSKWMEKQVGGDEREGYGEGGGRWSKKRTNC